MYNFRATILVALVGIASPALAGSSNHGGDGVRLTFAKARFTAIQWVRTYQAVPGISHEDVDTWISANATVLANDIEGSPYEWNDAPLAHEAMTSLSSKSPITFSLPLCRAAFSEQRTAAELLVHESVHHLGISDETFADVVAIAVSKSNSIRFPENPGEALWTPIENPQLGNQVLGLGAAMMDLEVFLWTMQTQGSAGRIFDPVTKKWRIASAVGQPSPRRDAAVVWTGEEVIVWGGRNPSGLTVFNDGARYNPKTDTWKKMSQTDAPEGRYSPATVWTGTRIYISNGYMRFQDHESLVGKPAMYDPTADRWYNIGGPYGENPSAFWTGDTGDPRSANKIITYPAAILDSFAVGIYDPQTNVWRYKEISYPQLYYDLGSTKWIDAVTWTGSKLFIFGWKVDVTHTDGAEGPAGVLFDPATETYEPIKVARSAPHLPSNYKAFMNGKDVLLAGGTGQISPLYKFDTVAMQWKVTNFSSDDVPTYESGQTVWTGESLIFLGGSVTSGRPSFGVMIEPR